MTHKTMQLEGHAVYITPQPIIPIKDWSGVGGWLGCCDLVEWISYRHQGNANRRRTKDYTLPYFFENWFCAGLSYLVLESISHYLQLSNAYQVSFVKKFSEFLVYSYHQRV